LKKKLFHILKGSQIKSKEIYEAIRKGYGNISKSSLYYQYSDYLDGHPDTPTATHEQLYGFGGGWFTYYDSNGNIQQAFKDVLMDFKTNDEKSAWEHIPNAGLPAKITNDMINIIKNKNLIFVNEMIDTIQLNYEQTSKIKELNIQIKNLDKQIPLDGAGCSIKFICKFSDETIDNPLNTTTDIINNSDYLINSSFDY
jgi:hypothetical protein